MGSFPWPSFLKVWRLCRWRSGLKRTRADLARNHKDTKAQKGRIPVAKKVVMVAETFRGCFKRHARLRKLFSDGENVSQVCGDRFRTAEKGYMPAETFSDPGTPRNVAAI